MRLYQSLKFFPENKGLGAKASGRQDVRTSIRTRFTKLHEVLNTKKKKKLTRNDNTNGFKVFKNVYEW